MELIVAIVRDEDAGRVTKALTEKGYKSTRISTASGFLRMSNTTLLIGVESPQVDEVLEIIKANCHPHTEPAPPPPSDRPWGFPPPSPATVTEIEVGRAVIFVLDIKRYERL
ncbi:MAG: cyclic-di-AMP receptor [Anaerolineae bacterium]